MSEMKKAPRAPGRSFQDLLQGYSSHPLPDYLRIDKSEWLGDEEIDVDRYISRDIAELEKERIWKKVWQMACREEEIPEVGDSIVYDIADISILVLRAAPGEIKAFYNVCLHQGRLLRDGPCHDKEVRCPYHSFTWNLDGSLKSVPSRWDFPQIQDDKFRLVEVKVGRWGGFVFINMDPNCESLESYLGDMPMHWERFPLEERYIAGHVAKVFRANWKVAQEAFMEAYHNYSTHSQFGVYFGGAASDTGQYDPMGNYSRALGQGSAELPLSFTPTREERLAAMSGHGNPMAVAKVQEAYLLQDDEEDLMAFELKVRRAALHDMIGDKADELSDFEVFGGGYFTLFPNFHPWWAYDELTYRFRPYKGDPEMCVMETYLLRPFKGERPAPAAVRWLGPDESHLDAADVLGLAARIFDQDEYNIDSVQKGLHNLKAIGRGLTLGTYQATKIRHFHKLWNQWVLGNEPAAKP
jgi:phenylpropionate dioxygenase-like ring-hydroxylating dioxygenase large terminal subunit